MSLNTAKYQDVSKVVGFDGKMEYPSSGYLSYLVHRLSVAPTLEDFKTGLKLFRFLPKPQNSAQEFMLQQLESALTLAREALFPNDSIIQNIIEYFNIRNLFRTPSRS